MKIDLFKLIDDMLIGMGFVKKISHKDGFRKYSLDVNSNENNSIIFNIYEDTFKRIMKKAANAIFVYGQHKKIEQFNNKIDYLL